jgi:group I intron endonuclease
MHHNQYLQHSWNKYGEGQFQFEVLEQCACDKLLDREQFWLDCLQPYDERGFNIARNAKAPQLGRPISSEHRSKIGAANRGRVPSSETRTKLSLAGKGRKHTPEELIKMSASQKGRVISLEARQKISAANKGKKRSEAARIKNSTMRKGKRPPHHVLAASNAACEKMWVLTSPDGQEISVQNLNRFCKGHGLDQGHMSRVAQGKLHHHKGWKCRHA